MQPFTAHTGMVMPLDRVNVDTDQMVPKQFLKALTREGLVGYFFMIGAICPVKNQIRNSF